MLCHPQNKKGVFKFEDKSTIENYLKEINILNTAQDDIFIFKNFENLLKFSQGGHLHGPVVHVFDFEGNHLEAITPEKTMDKLSDFKNIKRKAKKDSFNFKEWSSMFVNIQTLNDLKKINKCEYYFVIAWAKFFDNPQDIKEVYAWYDVLNRQKNKGVEIQVILLNMDLQNSWNLPEEKKENILQQLNK
jgi:hypothetical protein